MTNSKYDTHTDPLLKSLEMLKVKDVFDVKCLKLWYKFVNDELPHFFKSCLHITMNYMKRTPAAMVCSICIPRVLLVPVML